MAVALALVSAALYGTADFCGGLAGRRLPVTVVVAVSQAVGCALAAVGVAVLTVAGAGGDPTPPSLAWGGAAGVATGLAVLAFYWGLAHGSMSQVAPVAAVCSAVIPVAFSLVTGDVPDAVVLVGIGLAIPAVALVSRERTEADVPARDRRPLVAGLLAGAGFGAYFVLFDQAGTDAGLWPVAAARTASTVVALVAVVGAREAGELRRGVTPLVTGTGALDFVAIATYLAATGAGSLAVVAVITSLYPTSTVALARVVLHERFHRDQWVGLGLAVVAVALIALG